MKLFDKIKDLFMDEVAEDDEIEVDEMEEEEEVKFEELPKPKKEEPVLPKVMREAIRKEEEPKQEEKREEKKRSFVDPDEFMRELNMQQEKRHAPEPKIELPPKKFAFPMDIEEEPVKMVKPKEEVVIPSTPSRNVNVLDVQREAIKKTPELYPKKEEPKEKPKFKATPVISPVYGILDKNYKKEEVRERDEETNPLKRPSKKVDFETVRKKAFGNLADEIKDSMLCENCELYKEVKKISALSEDDLLYDMTVDSEKDEDVTIAKAYDNYEAFGVAYEPKVEKRTTDIHIEEEMVKDESEQTLEPSIEKFPKEEENSTALEDIINNSQKIGGAVINDHDSDEEVVTQDKPDMTYESKVEETVASVVPDMEEETPRRSTKKKDAKVDADFFELIDSMYKERTDD